jgi:hypothetical protein
MALDLERAAQRRMRILVIVLAAAVVLLAGIVVSLVAGGSGDGADPSPAPTGSPAGNDNGGPDDDPGYDPAETTQPPSDYAAPDEWVQLPTGSGMEEGLPVGFPQTSEGAVAMVVSSTRTGWTWDVAQAESGARVYVNADEREDALAMVDGSVRAVREYVGIAQNGPIPEGAALNAAPIGVQWEELEDGSVRVSTLTRVTFTPGGGEPTTNHLHTTVNDAVWEDGDWQVHSVPAEVVQDVTDPADIGSEEFNSLGWIAIQEGDVR